MKLIRIMVLFLACFCFTAVADSDTDAILLSTQTGIKTVTRINLMNTGVTIENGDVWVWGYRGRGLQGNGVRTVPYRSAPARVQTFVEEGLAITQVAAGRYHIIALDENGDVWGWGRNLQYEASGGVFSTSTYVLTPIKVLSGKRVIDIYCNEFTSYALTANGEIWVWGRGTHGEAGLNDRKVKNTVKQIPSSLFEGDRVRIMGVGYRSAYAITRAGTIYAWGETVSNKFCPENKKSCLYSILPIRINNTLVQSNSGIKSGAGIKQITGGRHFMAYLTYEGEVYGMGFTKYLADGKFDPNSLEENDDEEWVDGDDDDDADAVAAADDATDEKDGEDIRHDPYYVTESPIAIIGKDAHDEKDGVGYSIYCRFRGCVAITKHKSILTWGIKGSSRLKSILYNRNKASVAQRPLQGVLTKIDGGRQHLFYWNERGEVFGVGIGSYHKFDPSTSHTRDWDEKRMDFLMDAMHAVYGKDHVLGQVK
ncbi:hypothetical protein B6D12_11055 [Gilliamella apicola]|uniref:RCC1 domain-containing protein n=2 Tax=Orbaceae TaxID=1240483 RepID=UPI000810995D|nr:hypothetical protein A9G17_03535 [Gilliamella apicola]OTP87754.1 hypothetical protein B5S41_11480 [Gilliamella apicola]OTP92704.1 hypothetical protein B6D05_11600 [Gilliamella apicola]OTP92851.1 hypothetical protein B6D13_11540 [Gilliamella apicola]OTP99893.1 hypothetical protein B6D07_11275 [Gilliamella apicola]